MNTLNTFTPDYAIHPGEILEETLEARGITKADFARRCGISPKTVSFIIAGNASVSPDLAIQFERVLGVSSSLWNNLSADWSLYEARQNAVDELDTMQVWADCFPWREMVKRNWLAEAEDKSQMVDGLLSFFGVASPDAWENGFSELQVAYRKSPSFESSPYAVAAWLRRGEQLAGQIDTQPYDAGRFEEALAHIRALTVKSPQQFEPAMKELCRESGVAVVFESELPGTRLSGAARWLKKDKALIQLSLRHKTNDHFWFSFFHEAAHILKHAKRNLYLDDVTSGNTDLENEANELAADLLIPRKEYRRFCSETPVFSAGAVQSFAKQQGVAPGIVLGRLQHDKRIPYNSRLNKTLKKRFELIEDESI